MDKRRKRFTTVILIFAAIGLLISIITVCGPTFWNPQWTLSYNELCYLWISVLIYHLLKKDAFYTVMTKKRKRLSIGILVLADIGLVISIIEFCGADFWNPQWSPFYNAPCCAAIIVCVYHLFKKEKKQEPVL